MAVVLAAVRAVPKEEEVTVVEMVEEAMEVDLAAEVTEVEVRVVEMEAVEREVEKVGEATEVEMVVAARVVAARAPCTARDQATSLHPLPL